MLGHRRVFVTGLHCAQSLGASVMRRSASFFSGQLGGRQPRPTRPLVVGSDFYLVGSPGVDTWGVAMSDVMELCPPHGPRRPLDVRDYMFLSGVEASRLGWPVELICPMQWTCRIDHEPVMVDLKF